jgi:hypothetical protein
MAFATDPTKVVPQLAPVDDMGSFTYAVWQMPPGKSYMAAGTNCTWPETIETWSKITGIPASYRQVSPEEMIAACGEPQLGGEITDMFLYTSHPGYDGGMKLLQAEDIRKVCLVDSSLCSVCVKGLITYTDGDSRLASTAR